MLTGVKHRVSEKFYNTFPTLVRDEIKGFIGTFDHRNHGGIAVTTATVYTVTPQHQFVLSEGDKVFGIGLDGRVAKVEVVTSDNIGSSGVSMRIGSRFTMPSNTYLVVVNLQLGKYFCALYEVK